ncbi:MAG: hypothetical protein V2A75_03165 [Pseudomonadota bacterium]
MNLDRRKSKILYIGLDYYHYPKMITEGIEKLGYQVDYYPIEPRTLFYKMTRYLFKLAYRKALDKYHDMIITKSRAIKYDKVFFITTHFFSIDNLDKLKESQHRAEFISYHWDSLSKDYRYLETRDYFNRIYSFDKADCDRHGILYLPLFASGIYSGFSERKGEQDMDIYMVGSIVQTKRYQLVQEFKNFCHKNGISFYFHLKVTPVTYLKLLLSRVIPRGVSFHTMEGNLMKEIVGRSRAVLDVTNHEQSGLTMRVIENIAIGKKLVTTNINIEKEPFYNKNQVFLLGKDNMNRLKDFIMLDIKIEKHPELFLDFWLKKIFNDVEGRDENNGVN